MYNKIYKCLFFPIICKILSYSQVNIAWLPVIINHNRFAKNISSTSIANFDVTKCIDALLDHPSSLIQAGFALNIFRYCIAHRRTDLIRNNTLFLNVHRLSPFDRKLLVDAYQVKFIVGKSADKLLTLESLSELSITIAQRTQLSECIPLGSTIPLRLDILKCLLENVFGRNLLEEYGLMYKIPANVVSHCADLKCFAALSLLYCHDHDDMYPFTRIMYSDNEYVLYFHEEDEQYVLVLAGNRAPIQNISKETAIGIIESRFKTA